MKISAKKRDMIRALLDITLIIFTIPPAFVTAYFFPLFFSGANDVALAKTLLKFSLHVSWVSAPVIVITVLALKFMIRRKRKWFSILMTSYAAGFIWLLLWNLVVENLFTFWRSVIPLSLCCLFSMAYAMGKALYNNDEMNFSDEPDLDFMEAERVILADETPLVDDDSEGKTEDKSMSPSKVMK